MDPLTLLVVRRLADNENIPTDRANQLGVMAAILPSNIGLVVGALAVRNEAVPAPPAGGRKDGTAEPPREQPAADASSNNRNQRR